MRNVVSVVVNVVFHLFFGIGIKASKPHYLVAVVANTYSTSIPVPTGSLYSINQSLSF
jgi:hypothetical protein